MDALEKVYVPSFFVQLNPSTASGTVAPFKAITVKLVTLSSGVISEISTVVVTVLSVAILALRAAFAALIL